MRVLFVTGEFPPMQGGVGDYTACIGRALVELGVDVSVLTSTRAGGNAEWVDGMRVSPAVRRWGFGTWGQVADVADRVRPDIVHIQYQTGAFDMHPAVNLLPLRFRLRRGRPSIAVTFHDLGVPYLFPKAGPLRAQANALLMRFSDAIVVTNHEDAGEVAAPGALWRGGRARSRFGPTAHFIPIGSNIPRRLPASYERAAWRQRLGLAPEELVLSYFGFLSDRKGLETLLATLRVLAEKGLPVKLLMVGGTASDSNPRNRSYADGIMALCESPELRGRVVWTGFTGGDEVSANLLASDIAVLPFRAGASIRHGSLVAVLVHGLPTITTCRASLRAPVEPDGEVLDNIRLVDGVNCKLVPPDDVECLAAAIAELGESEDERSRLGEGASALAPAFAWERIARRTLEMYREVVGT